jgi:uncharacterized protein (DUF2384 family)
LLRFRFGSLPFRFASGYPLIRFVLPPSASNVPKSASESPQRFLIRSQLGLRFLQTLPYRSLPRLQFMFLHQADLIFNCRFLKKTRFRRRRDQSA